MSKLGIIVPYRDRYEHLTTWTREIKHYLHHENIKYTVIIVEQDNASAFNRGMLCNIGFKQAIKEKCDYVVFHDVDMIPIDIDYSPSKTPVHLFDTGLPFANYFGGITLFPVKDFKKINGFSNMYWGWGYEDDDLRYRCSVHGIDLGHRTNKVDSKSLPSAIFNGLNTEINISNKINFNVDFSIEIQGNLGHIIMDQEKPMDVYPLLRIKGNDFKLDYNSFNRFELQVFDKNNKLYPLVSDIHFSSYFKIKVEYVSRNKQINFYLNEKPPLTVNLETSIYNYSTSENILIGRDFEKTSYFIGSIESLAISTRGNRIKHQYNCYQEDEYIFKDKVGGNDGTLRNIIIGKYTVPKTVETDNIVPHRRKGLVAKLNHEDNGYAGGRWKSNLTRWNQLRYNNEVKLGSYSNVEDGLSTCEYTEYGIVRKKNLIHLNVGI